MSKVEQNVLDKKEVQYETTKKQKNLSTKVFYRNSNEVVSKGYKDYNDFSKNTERKQRMKGFDDTYRDFVDYILTITHRIWEEKEIGLIYDTYSNDIKVHTGINTFHGINQVVSNTLQSLHGFPDDREIGDNVVWSGNDEEGFHSSHRITSIGTNLNESSYGPATGKKITYRSTADCFCYANRIVEEWIVRDGLYIVEQLGIDPIDYAKKLAKQSISNPKSLQTNFGMPEAMDGQIVPKVYKKQCTEFEVGDFILDMYNKIWERRLFNHVKDFYTDNATVHYIKGTSLVGFNQIQGAFISLLASFPTSKFIVERVTCNERNSHNEWDVAVRWRLQGIHEGIGYFGKPMGKPVEILGISHFRIVNEKVVEEWITFDGLEVLRQIYVQTLEQSEIIED